MYKYPDVLLWLILPLLIILPFAAYAETIRCATELKRLCDGTQACTTTSSIHPAVEYLIDMPNQPAKAKIVRLIGGKKAATWRVGLTASEGDSQHDYFMRSNDSNRFTLSRSFKTFSYKFTAFSSKSGWEQNELGTCSVSAP